MRATVRLPKALSSALLPLLGAAVLAGCGGGGMGTSSMGSPTAMGNSSMGMPCSMMDMSMNCASPGVTMMAPVSPVNRSVTLSATVSAASGDMITAVNFLVDGAEIGANTGRPYTISWDSTTVSDGLHTIRAQVTDTMDRTTTSAAINVQVLNNPTFTVALSPTQLIPAPPAGASGTASLSAHLGSGSLAGTVTLSGVTASAVSINEGFAGDSGSTLVTLTASGSGGEWQVPPGTLLTADQVSALMRGGVYVLAVSSARPTGEVRGQITPANVMVTFSSMAGTQEVPPVSIAASGTAATTVDASANTLTMHVHTAGIGDAMAGQIDTGAMGATGATLAVLEKDSVDPGHWSAQLVPIAAEDVTNFEAADWYVNIATPTEPQGAIRGQIAAPTR
jgi:hypothetical protein